MAGSQSDSFQTITNEGVSSLDDASLSTGVKYYEVPVKDEAVYLFQVKPNSSANAVNPGQDFVSLYKVRYVIGYEALSGGSGISPTVIDDSTVVDSWDGLNLDNNGSEYSSFVSDPGSANQVNVPNIGTITNQMHHLLAYDNKQENQIWDRHVLYINKEKYDATFGLGNGNYNRFVNASPDFKVTTLIKEKSVAANEVSLISSDSSNSGVEYIKVYYLEFVLDNGGADGATVYSVNLENIDELPGSSETNATPNFFMNINYDEDASLGGSNLDEIANMFSSYFLNTALEADIDAQIDNSIKTVITRNILFRPDNDGSFNDQAVFAPIQVEDSEQNQDNTVDQVVEYGDVTEYVKNFLNVRYELENTININDINIFSNTWVPDTFRITFFAPVAPPTWDPFYNATTATSESASFRIDLSQLQITILNSVTTATSDYIKTIGTSASPVGNAIKDHLGINGALLNSDDSVGSNGYRLLNQSSGSLYIYKNGAFVPAADKVLAIDLLSFNITSYPQFLTQPNVFTFKVNGNVTSEYVKNDTSRNEKRNLRVKYEEYVDFDAFDVNVTPPVRNLIIAFVVFILSLLAALTMTIVALVRRR